MRLRYTLLAAALLAAPLVSAQTLPSLPFYEGFGYTAGDTLNGKGGWKVHSGTSTTNGPTVDGNDLAFAGYTTSPTGSLVVAGGSGSRKDLNNEFTSVTTGTTYAAAVVNVAAATATSDYFFHLAANGLAGASFRARVGLQTAGSGFVFTLSKAGTSGTALAAETTERTFGTSYLVVIKYTIVDGTGNDPVDLFVLPQGSSLTSEPSTPTLSAPDVTASDINPGAVALRQGAQAYSVFLDGVRVTTAWPVATAADDESRPGNRALAIWGSRVRLTVDTPGSVNVTLYDVLGREVTTLFAGSASGTVEARLPDGLTPGVYIVRALGNGLAAAKTVVIR
ncbi:MAG: T9SS type A sorting domain-containing protein [Rhodothermales bacterium]|nr:T9SS type A sorting domain-containing protein [Rhodothermales bacterium]